MAIHTAAEKLIHDIIHDRAQQYAHDVRQFQEQKARLDKAGEAHEKKQIKLMTSVGLKPAELEASLKEDAKALDAYLAKYRPPLVSRAGSPANDGKSASLFASQLPPGIITVPPYGVFAPPQDPPPPEITSGWIFSAAGNLKIAADDTGSGTGWWAVAAPPPVPHDVIFTFIPAVTANYDLTAIFAFHGFYVLVADDGFFTHKYAEVTMDVAISAHQYVDLQWKNFPRPIDASEDNANKLVSYDRTIFFDYSAPLRAGDPVVVTARITLNAVASGSGSHAEINFSDGTANYIMPLFLSVGPA